MSLHYLLDGYNVTKQIPALARQGLKNERDSLISLVETRRPQGSLNNKVTIVFDGRPGIIHAQKNSHVKIVFSQNESGDEKIRRIVKDAVYKKRIIVVTDDKELGFSVRAHGAKLLSVKDFLAKIDIQPAGTRTSKPQKKTKEEQKRIPKTLEYKITSELEQIWLNKKHPKHK